MAEELPYHFQFRRNHQLELALAIVLVLTIPVAIGIWRAQEWARVTFGVMAIVSSIVGIGLMARDFNGIGHSRLAAHSLEWGAFAGGAFVAYHLLGPGAARSFADARESIARASAEPE